MPPSDPPIRDLPDPRSRALPIAVVGLLAVVIADLVAGGTALTIIAVTLLAGVAFALIRAQRTLAHTAQTLVAERDAERTARRRADLVAAVSELLESMLEPRVMLARLTDLFVPALGDVAVLDLLQRDGSLRGAVTAAVDEAVAEDLRRLREEHPLQLASNHPVATALRTREPVLLQNLPDKVRDYADSPEHVAHVVGFGYQSVLVLPLIGHGATFGTLSFVRGEGREPFTDDEVQLGRDLAGRAALALDNARLFDDLRRAEGRLEAIVESLGEAVAAIAPDGSLRFANSAAAEFAGVADVDALIARGSAALLDRWKVLDENGEPVAMQDLLVVRALAGETPSPRLKHAIDRDSGHDRWLFTRAVPVADSDGAVDFVVWVGEDVTAVKRQEVRERLLSNASKMLASSLDVDATIDKAAWAVVPELADWARIDLRDERGALVQMAVAHRDLERVELLNEWRRDFPPAEEDDRGPAEVMRTGTSIVWADVDRRGCRPLRPVAASRRADADHRHALDADRADGRGRPRDRDDAARDDVRERADARRRRPRAGRGARTARGDRGRPRTRARDPHAHRHHAAAVAAATEPARHPRPGDCRPLPGGRDGDRGRRRLL